MDNLPVKRVELESCTFESEGIVDSILSSLVLEITSASHGDVARMEVLYLIKFVRHPVPEVILHGGYCSRSELPHLVLVQVLSIDHPIVFFTILGEFKDAFWKSIDIIKCDVLNFSLGPDPVGVEIDGVCTSADSNIFGMEGPSILNGH